MSLVSCIMATKNRPHFLKQAIKYFQQQTFQDSELVVVDDSAVPCEHLLPRDPRFRYIRLTNEMQLGEKLNVGIRNSNSPIIQKLDDDDYYHPHFLETTISTLVRPGHKDVVAAMGAFLVLVVGSPHLYSAGDGWFAGGTFCFFREAWQAHPFRDLSWREDVAFLEDHPYLQKFPILNPELYVLVRHGNHTWNTIKADSPVNSSQLGMDPTHYFSSCSPYPKPITELLNPEDVRFYSELPLSEAVRLIGET
jgi:glycosyltransferase involved in cell wall biosynthesis